MESNLFLNHLKEGERILKQLHIINGSVDEMFMMIKKEQAVLKRLRSMCLNKQMSSVQII